MSDQQTGVNVKVRSCETATARFSGVSTNACRTDGTTFFDTAKSFIYPRYKPALEQAFAFGLTGPAAGTGPPAPAPDRFMLIVGHTDHVGSAQTNDRLSERRARAALAVFTIDADAWENLYKAENWGRGTIEIETMSAEVDPGGSSDPGRIQHYRDDAQARLDLFHRYLISLRPDWLPQSSPPASPAMVAVPPKAEPLLGCGFHQLRVPSQGAVLENRRTEFFYFGVADPGVRDCSTYRSWQATCGQFITVQIELLDEYGEPYVGPFDLTLPTGGVLRNERTDKLGAWTRDNLPAGQYTLTIAGNSITLLR